MLIDDTRCKDKMKEDVTFAMGGSEGQVVRVLCVPKFSETHVAVMLSVISKLATNCIGAGDDHPMIMLFRGTDVGQTSNKWALKEH
ncbi:hypothetical protein Tco_0575035 [Tanacetum coccineum]